MTETNRGNLADKPLAELIRDLGETSASGALRLSRDRAKAVVYFENGAVVFAASNIRVHRLSEFVKRSGIVNEASFADASVNTSDEEVLELLVKQGEIKPDDVNNIRSNHVADILRATLLWTEAEWQFDPRVRIAGDTRVKLDTRRLLLESTRHLPATYIASRFADPAEMIEGSPNNGYAAGLLPSEAFVASRLSHPMAMQDLKAISGLGEEETLRAVYALAMTGVITRAAWAPVNTLAGKELAAGSRVREPKTETVEEFLARLDQASDHYQVLGVGRHAAVEDIKNAYHGLARVYHPDRFHQADIALRTRIESAFARIARAYEILWDSSSRASYDAQLSSEGAAARKTADRDRAAASFQKALAAMKQNQQQEALRFFAEAANLDPRRAQYRAEYGRALIDNPQTRRVAETELKAAIALEPTNASYRVMLAELYKVVGLRRRAEGELERALAADPKNKAARALLASLKE